MNIECWKCGSYEFSLDLIDNKVFAVCNNCVSVNVMANKATVITGKPKEYNKEVKEMFV